MRQSGDAGSSSIGVGSRGGDAACVPSCDASTSGGGSGEAWRSLWDSRAGEWLREQLRGAPLSGWAAAGSTAAAPLAAAVVASVLAAGGCAATVGEECVAGGVSVVAGGSVGGRPGGCCLLAAAASAAAVAAHRMPPAIGGSRRWEGGSAAEGRAALGPGAEKLRSAGAPRTNDGWAGCCTGHGSGSESTPSILAGPPGARVAEKAAAKAAASLGGRREKGGLGF